MGNHILIEDKQVNKAIETIRNDFNKCPSVKKVEDTKKSTITEGLKFFKASPRLFKLSEKLVKKAKKPNLTDSERKNIEKTSRKIHELGNKFERAEDLFDVGKKAQARTMEKELKTKYVDILKLLRKQDIIDALKKVGGIAITASMMIVPYMLLNKFFPSLSFTSVNNQAAAEKGFKEQFALYAKRSGAFALCGLPVKAARGIMNKGVDTYDNMILNSIDKKLNSSEGKDIDIIQ